MGIAGDSATFCVDRPRPPNSSLYRDNRRKKYGSMRPSRPGLLTVTLRPADLVCSTERDVIRCKFPSYAGPARYAARYMF